MALDLARPRGAERGGESRVARLAFLCGGGVPSGWEEKGRGRVKGYPNLCIYTSYFVGSICQLRYPRVCGRGYYFSMPVIEISAGSKSCPRPRPRIQY